MAIHCAVCLNTRNPPWPQATTIINGYAVCDDHTELVSRPDFNIFTLRTLIANPV
jgi:hypothetical protein